MERAGGVLTHITSLPGNEGCGTLGKEAYHFIGQLYDAGIKLWQILPLGPTGIGNSPYLCYSVFAGNPLLISLNLLVEHGLLNYSDIERQQRFKEGKVDFEKIISWKYPLLKKAYENFREGGLHALQNKYNAFLNEHGWWLDDYALFMALKKHFRDKPWHDWDIKVKQRDKGAIDSYNTRLNKEVEFRKFKQFLFFKQWHELKEYANSKGILIIGDMPLYVAGNSVDVWANPDIFKLDKNYCPTHVGGVPPDYFSKTGQLWGNPIYNWQCLINRGFDWWMARLHFNLNLFDFARIDHFRGLESFWSVPANEKTAINGEWMPAPGYKMLKKFKGQKGEMPLIAEDLGLITPEVIKLRDRFHLPGMKVLQFAFSDNTKNKNLPHNYTTNYIAYTGTHDNDTMLSWYKSAGKGERGNARKYFKCRQKEIARRAIESIWASVADVAIAPIQDVLNLGSKARMNTPGTATGNWDWRLKNGQFKTKHIQFLKELGEMYNR